MNRIIELGHRANISVFSLGEKDIVLYDDHRTLLNVLFEADRKALFPQIPNLIYFDFHDDACWSLSRRQLLEKIGVDNLSEATSKQFWSFVEFDLGTFDDDWLLTGMELGLIKNAVLIGGEETQHISNDMDNNCHISDDGVRHEVYNIPHLRQSVGCRGCLGDSIIKEPYYQNVRDIFQYHRGRFDDAPAHPFVLDFDLDCFTTSCRGETYAWPEDIFRREYVDNTSAKCFLDSLIERACFITICREPDCCGGIGESNKILHYLDKYFFDGAIHTIPIY